MKSINITDHLRSTLGWASWNLVNDLKALSEEDAANRPYPAARSAIETLAHCAATDRDIAALLRADSAAHPPPEERTAFLAAVATRDQVLETFEAAAQDLEAAINGVGEGRWGEAMDGPFGPSTFLATATLAALHTMYHDGQLNHVHVMNGDNDMHWF